MQHEAEVEMLIKASAKLLLISPHVSLQHRRLQLALQPQARDKASPLLHETCAGLFLFSMEGQGNTSINSKLTEEMEQPDLTLFCGLGNTVVVQQVFPHTVKG